MAKCKPKLGDVRYRRKETSIIHRYTVQYFYGGLWHHASAQHDAVAAKEMRDKLKGVLADIIREARETRDEN